MRSWMVPALSGGCSWCLSTCWGAVGWGRMGFQPQLVVLWQVAAPGPPDRAAAQGEAVAHRLSFPTASSARACFISPHLGFFPFILIYAFPVCFSFHFSAVSPPLQILFHFFFFFFFSLTSISPFLSPPWIFHFADSTSLLSML